VGVEKFDVVFGSDNAFKQMCRIKQCCVTHYVLSILECFYRSTSTLLDISSLSDSSRLCSLPLIFIS
jgi:hypothetical protein